MKKKFNKIKYKKLKEEKNKIENLSKKKKGKKLVAGILGVALLYAIHSATIKKIFYLKIVILQIYFVLLTQLMYLYILKKLLLTRCGAQANMLTIILLYNDYFLKYF